MNCFFCGKKLHYNHLSVDGCNMFDKRTEHSRERVLYIGMGCIEKRESMNINVYATFSKGIWLYPNTGNFINILKRLTELGTKFEGVSIV